MSRRGSWHLTLVHFLLLTGSSAAQRDKRNQKRPVCHVFLSTSGLSNIITVRVCVLCSVGAVTLSCLTVSSQRNNARLCSAWCCSTSIVCFFAGCVCVWLCVCVCVWPFLTLAHAQWDFTETVGCYDYKLASVLIRFGAVKGGGFYSVSLSGTKGGLLFCWLVKKAALNDLWGWQ